MLHVNYISIKLEKIKQPLYFDHKTWGRAQLGSALGGSLEQAGFMGVQPVQSQRVLSSGECSACHY